MANNQQESREAVARAATEAWRIPCSTRPGDTEMCKPKDDCLFGYEQGYLAALNALTSTPERASPGAAEAMQEAAAKVADQFVDRRRNPLMTEAGKIAAAIRALPAPEQPAQASELERLREALRETQAERDFLRHLITKVGVYCDSDDEMVLLTIENESDASVGLDGRWSLLLPDGFEVRRAALATHPSTGERA